MEIIYNNIQKIIDNNINHEILLIGDMNARARKNAILNVVEVYGDDKLIKMEVF